MDSTTLDRIALVMNDYPLLWVVYGFTILLPVVGAIACCFWPKRLDATAHRKKTDAPTPDAKIVIEERRNGTQWHVSPREQRRAKPVVNPASKQSSGEDRGVSQPMRESSAVTKPATRVVEKSRGTQQEAKRRIVEKVGEGDDQLIHQQSVVEGEGREVRQWSFPPKLEEFNLMESDTDPSELETIFEDERLSEIKLTLDPDGPGLGISIVGGGGSPNGDLPIIIKRVLPNCVAEKDGRLKSGDELIAVNDTLLVGVSKDFAINALSSMRGHVRLLALQDD